ncbi:hypothetical protein OG884_00655 [Streptosporangium sp. NBC_01755]|nr:MULTISPECIES: hypothetical protein [unclassified Streptosporangium]WSA28042.1 hypothetical protein OIE13_09310 [Streptosporangium sp. NBC_01810]WSD00486.1 hypothetical protein OG884_00655 [Streptosporangium sp. NBC_01755]
MSYGETKGRFYAPGARMRAIKDDFAQRIVPLRDPYWHDQRFVP